MAKLINFLQRFWFYPKSRSYKKLKKAIYAITTIEPKNLSLYKLAFQHSSIKNESPSNERLEFLGDAVLSLIIAGYLFKKYPLQKEGFLTEVRSRIVNRTFLGELAKKIGIDQLLVYDSRSVNHQNLKFIYGNALEAFIGAVYLDQGYKACAKFTINRLLQIYIDVNALVLTDTNYKSKIIAWAQKNRKKIQFELINEKKNNGVREFLIQVLLDNEISGEGIGRTKKQAEQMAAQDTLKRLGNL